MAPETKLTRAAAATVEALVYSCRQGTKALQSPNNIRRLRELTKGQLKEVFERVQLFRGDLEYEGKQALRWSAAEALTLLERWQA